MGMRDLWRHELERCGVYLGCTQAVVTQNLVRRVGIHEHERRTDPLAPVLLGKALQVIVKFGNAAIETVAVMHAGVERALLKHDGLSAAPPSAPAIEPGSARKAR